MPITAMRHAHDRWPRFAAGHPAGDGIGRTGRAGAALCFLVAVVLSPPAAAQDGPDKPAFGSQEHLSEIVGELSPANKALFVDNHLEEISKPARIHYDFEKESALEDDIAGSVLVNVVKVRPSGRKDMTFRFLKGRNKVRFPPQFDMNGNPVFMLFLERDAREMQRYTGGNALYFRNRVRHALAAADVTPVAFDFAGRQVEGKEIRVRPFQVAELAERFPRYRDKEYVFLLSNEVPGAFYRISTSTPSQSGEGWLSRESLTFQGVSDNKKR